MTDPDTPRHTQRGREDAAERPIIRDDATGSAGGSNPALPSLCPAGPRRLDRLCKVKSLAGEDMRAALADHDARLHAWLVWRDLERRGWASILTRDPVAVRAVSVLVTQGLVTTRETEPGLVLVELTIVADESEDEREAREAAELWERSTYDDGSVRLGGGEP